ncbi:MAG: 60S ribosomal protein L22 [Candidatus Bathyarchaeia archaeon]
MSEARININELKSEGSDLIKELATYLKEKTNAKIETGTNELVVKGEEANVSRTYLRVLLKKFLHKNELKNYFRVIGGKENTLIVKGRKATEEEE